VAAAVHTFQLEGVEDEATLREAMASMVMAGEGIDNEQWHDLVAEFGGLAGWACQILPATSWDVIQLKKPGLKMR